jgi:RNA polymerase II elongation factor ELL
VRPYVFAGLSDDERRKMWRKARQYLHDMGIPESDAAWDHVRNLPSSSETGSGPKRPTGVVGAERKKNAGSTSKAPIEAKDERARPSQAANVREEAMQAQRPTKSTTPKREEDDPPPRRLPGTSGPRNAREPGPPQSQSQAQGPSKKVGLTDARAKHGDSSKSNGRPRLPTPIQPSSSHERSLERGDKPHVTKKHREDGSDLDREKVMPAPAPKVKRLKDDASDLESLRDWDSVGKTNGKRKKMREDHDDKDRANGTGNTIKRRKVVDDDRPYKPSSGGGGTSKARERDRDRELDRGQDKTRSRAAAPVAKRPRDSDRGSPDASLVPRKSTVREDERRRKRETDRSLSPPRRVKRELSMSPALHNSHQHEGSPLLRGSTKRTNSPPREAIKREGSPRPRVHSRRGDSPPAPRTSKRAPSPLSSQERARGRDREASANGVSTTRRRRSPIYTSSSDEDDHHNAPVRRNAPSSATSTASSREPPRNQGYASLPPPPPTAPYPKDRKALQARYRSGYRSYFSVYSKLLEQREKNEDALNDGGHGREGSVCSDRDAEVMDEDGLRGLFGLYASWTKELEGIIHAYSAEAERMDITT